jgi:hypothetical protein
MKIKNEEVNVDDLLKDVDLEKDMLKDYGNGMLLTENYVEILNRYDIDYKKYSDLNSLIYEIEECLNDSYGLDVDDLEWLATELSERNYYQNIRK